MKIMLLSDAPDKALWDHLNRELLDGVELVLSCGDLPAEYLSFLTCFTHAPIVYVYGNHDDRYDEQPPEGCLCAEDTIIEVNGLRILGLGGCMKYRPSQHMFTENQMAMRARKLAFKLHRSKGFDILLTHAPARGLGDQEDLAHQGFETFNRLIDRWQPKLMAHGHVHPEYANLAFRREHVRGNTRIVNGYMRYFVEI